MRLLLIILLTTASSAAAAPKPSTSAVIDIATAAYRSCALHADHSVSCWGYQMGSQPIGVPALDGAVEIEGVHDGVCGRFSDGSVKCLGADDNLVKQTLTGVVALGAGCARTGKGTLWCLDLDTAAWTLVPKVAKVVDADGWRGAGCAALVNGTVACWSSGQRDLIQQIGAAPDGSARVVRGVTSAVEVAVGTSFACARRSDGTVSCWGIDREGNLGRGTAKNDTTKFTPPAPVIGLTDAVELIANVTFACARRKSGALACWGALPWKPAGTITSTPETIKLSSVAAIAASPSHICAVGGGRDVSCWGENRQGQLGIGYSAVLFPPRELPGITDAVSVHAFAQRTCVARRSGAVSCIGDTPALPTLKGMRSLSNEGDRLTGLDANGQLWFDGDTKPRRATPASAHAGACTIEGGVPWCHGSKSPVRVSPMTDAVELAGDTGNLCVRRATGDVACFRLEGSTFVQEGTVAGIHDAVSISARGYGGGCAIRKNGSAWCWRDVKAPTQIAGITDAIAVDLGESSGWQPPVDCALRKPGSVVCWGADNGLLGDLRTQPPQPVTIPGIVDAVALSLARRHACVLTKRGTVACWGATEYGATGTQHSVNVPTPQPVVWP